MDVTPWRGVPLSNTLSAPGAQDFWRVARKNGGKPTRDRGLHADRASNWPIPGGIWPVDSDVATAVAGGTCTIPEGASGQNPVTAGGVRRWNQILARRGRRRVRPFASE